MKKIAFTLVFTIFLSGLLQAQDKDSIPKPWDITLGIGLDFIQLLQINPKVGAGENKIGFGWALSNIAKYQKDRLAWDNSFLWNFSIQRLCGGTFQNSEEKVPFQKSIDEFRLVSKAGYKLRDTSKFFYAVDFSLLGQVTRTYKGNYLIDIQDPDVDDDPISKFLSPAQMTFSIGIDYKPSKHLSVFLSPVGYKSIIVADDVIADDVVRNSMNEITGSVHGNPIETSADKMTLLSFNNMQHNLGSLLRVSYNNQFYKKKLTFKSGMVVYANYLADVGRLDFEWTTETAFTIFKGLQFSLLTTLFYDYDVFAYRTNYNLPGGIETTPERDLISFTEQFLIKYNVKF